MHSADTPPLLHHVQFGQDYSLSREIEINDVPNPQRYSLTKGLFQEEVCAYLDCRGLSACVPKLY